MTTVTLTDTAIDAVSADALVVGVFKSAAEDGQVSVTGSRPDIAAAAEAAGATGKVGEVVKFAAPDGLSVARVVAVGVGPEPEVTAERVRRAAGAASRATKGEIASLLGGLNLRAAAEGHLLGAYRFTGYKKPKDEGVTSVSLMVDSADAAARSELSDAIIAAEAVCLARDLVNTAPNDLPPAVFADRARAVAEAAGLAVEVLDEDDLAEGGYGGVLGVGSGSARPPRLVRISYAPQSPRTSVALVGKGITFDSGGLSIKPAAGMDHMTSDMAGAASVVAAMVAVAAHKLPISVTATVPMAENLPSGSSYRPGDVLSHRGGQTVHVLNTDAEGRLILADAIVRACEDDPDYLLTVATLTGAQIVALGNRTTGVMGTEQFRDRVAELGREVGEEAWAMPLPEELREGLDSPLADIANVSGDRAGGMLVAGHYLKHFVADGVSWAHLDVAGPAFNTKSAHGYTPQGATGIPVRTLIAALADIAAS